MVDVKNLFEAAKESHTMSKYMYSVVTPFHNVDMEMFENAAVHMEQQTIGFENIEWIIVCHNCDDEHIKAVKARVGSYPNVIVRILNNNIHTPSNPRNHGLDFATADYVGFLDGDDNYRVDAIEKILDVFRRIEPQMVVFRRGFEMEKAGIVAISEMAAYNQTRKEVVISIDSDIDIRKYNDWPFFITSRAYDRRFLEAHGIRFDDSITISEDCYFNLEVLRYSDKICYCPQLIGYNYYINSKSMLNAPKSNEEILTMIESAVKIIRRALDNGFYSNTIIKTLCFVVGRYAMNPDVSYEVKMAMKESLEGYLAMTHPVPAGRFTEPFNTLLNTYPQQVFAGMVKDRDNLASVDGQDILTSILSTNRETDYGQRYLFSDIVTRRGFQTMVPISDYSTYAPLIDLQTSIGEKNIFCSDAIVCYVKDYCGRSLPVTAKIRDDFVSSFTKVLKGKVVFFWYQGMDSTEVYNDGIPSTTMLKMLMSGYCDSYRYDEEKQICAFTSPEILYYLKNIPQEELDYANILLALAERELDQIIYFFADDTPRIFQYMVENRKRLVRDLEDGGKSVAPYWPALRKKELDGYLHPDAARAQEVGEILEEGSCRQIAKKLWKNLKYVTCFFKNDDAEKGREIIKEYYGDVTHRQGPVATHAGVFGEAVEGTDYYKLKNGVNFYEFMEEGAEEPVRPVFCSDLKEGGVYDLIVTTPAGLYRYRTGIRIQILTLKGADVFFRSEC